MLKAPYGTWESPISVDDLVGSGVVRLSETKLDGDTLYWLEGRPAEAGRVALLRRDPAGTIAEIAPEFSVRSRVHEYGGGAYDVRDGVVVFTDLGSGRVWVVEPEGFRALTPENSAWRFGDLRVHPDRGLILAVREDHSLGGEPINTLVALTLTGENPDGGRVLCSGADFYASPELSGDGRLAWVEWHHPAMPWEASQLRIAPLDGLPADHGRVVAGGDHESAAAPTWLPDGRLAFLCDRTGYTVAWIDGEQPRPLVDLAADFAQPLWVLGASWLAPYRNGLACAPIVEGRSSPSVLDLETGRLAPLDIELTSVGWLSASAGRLALIAGRADAPPAVLVIETGQAVLVRSAAALKVDPALVSRATAVTWASADGPVSGWFYPPVNPNYQASDGERPPLIVLSHGGPTAMATADFALNYQFWTSRGLAILDVNYGGSSGYGRAYRERLRGQWGVVDVADCIAGALSLADRGLVDRQRLAIQGGSAGGYTTLRALTVSDVFRVGVSRYGVGDLTALATDTHKFESRYLDGLVGPWPEAEALYRERSPINHVDQLSCPMLILQGADDLVVPPNQAEQMAAAVRAKGLPVELLIFEGEGHGFRRADTIRRATSAELAFYRRVLCPTAETPRPAS